METLFEFFEELDEMVYVSDVETHELVYMNRHLRENLGYLSHESYRGKKCYAVLQMKDRPCCFCNHADLKENQFVTWIHENSVLKQRLIVKDKLMVSNGHRYRIEIAVKADERDVGQLTYFYNRSEAILNEALQYFFVTEDPEASIDLLLTYLGKKFHSERTYIFEFDDHQMVDNTYEWCAPGISAQKEILQRLPISDVDYWMESFQRHEAVLIHDLENIRMSHPSTYSLLCPQGIESLIVVPIYEKDDLKGFIGVDNPDKGALPLLEKVLGSLSGTMGMQLRRRNLYQRFNKMSYQDSLTGAYNGNALEEHIRKGSREVPFGAVSCEINGVKETNDLQGHDAGNKLLENAHHILQKALNTEWIYRISSGEFIALYYGVEESRIKADLDVLQMIVMQSDCQISVGYAWSDQQPIQMEQIMNQADAMMRQEKATYYERLKQSLEGISGPGEAICPQCSSGQMMSSSQLILQKFLSNTYCDIPFLLTLLSTNNGTSYFFFGDMQKNLYYISDNMRDKFGFESNIVPDLTNRWAARIQDTNLLEKFWEDINNLLEKKQNYHDLRYPIADAQGNHLWIRCFGKVKWTEDGTKPLFFAGRISQQDEGFVVDSLTNFPTETVLLQHLNYISEHGEKCRAIGISFNNIAQINNNLGRSYGDDLVREITENLYAKLSHTVAFYRLTGMRCLALIEFSTIEEAENLIREIKKIIEETYQHMGLLFSRPCSFALLNYPQGDASPKDFIEDMVSLIKMARTEPKQLYIDNSNGDIQKIQDLSNLEMCLIQDIMNNMENFRAVVQPVVETVSGRPIGGETLLRWRYEGKDVSPGIFIPIIERENLIHLVGRWVFEEAVRACKRSLSYCPSFYLTVNASLQQLNDEGFLDFIQETMTKYQLPGEHIVIEMTESCMDEEPEKLLSFVKACASMDIRIALDDFGSGYSSLRVLLQYPSSIIKLDRSLLMEMTDSSEKNNFITSIVYACHQFGKKVCMEGVETNLQNELVREAGCDMIQGFYFYRPMEIDQIYQLLAEKFDQEQGNAGQ